MERELSVSYPTVRARVEALVRALGFGETAAAARSAAGAEEDGVPDRRVVLERLARREITAEQAASLLRQAPASRGAAQEGGE
jgi:hypothetical protein